MQDILIHVRDFELRTPALDFGVRLAAQSGASATAVYACQEPVHVVPAFDPQLLAAVMENTRLLVREAVQARREATEWAASLGVANLDWRIAQGEPVDALAQAAARHDLLVLDHGDVDHGTPWDVPGLVLKVGVPCIVVPQSGAHPGPSERIAIGWNGSPEAMRAVHAALPFLRGKRVLLLRGEERDGHAVDWNPPFQIHEYLQRHGVTVVQHAVDAKPDAVGEVLLEEARQFRAGLLVMGAYGRSRFSEWLLGGATRDVLAGAEIPVLLCH